MIESRFERCMGSIDAMTEEDCRNGFTDSLGGGPPPFSDSGLGFSTLSGSRLTAPSKFRIKRAIREEIHRAGQVTVDMSR